MHFLDVAALNAVSLPLCLSISSVTICKCAVYRDTVTIDNIVIFQFLLFSSRSFLQLSSLTRTPDRLSFSWGYLQAVEQRRDRNNFRFSVAGLIFIPKIQNC